MRKLDFSVGQRLAAATVIIAILIGFFGIAVSLSIARVKTLRDQKLNVIAPRAEAADRLETAIYQQAVAFRNYAISGSPADLEAFNRSKELVNARLEKLSSLPKTPQGQALFAEIVPLLDQHQRSFQTFLDLARSGADRNRLRESEIVISGRRNAALAKLKRFADIQKQQTEAADIATGRAMEDLRRTAVALTVLVLLASILTAVMVSSSVRRPAVRLAAAAEAMRDGAFGPALALEEKKPNLAAEGARKPFRDELTEAGHVFGTMAAALKRREATLAAHSKVSALLGTSLVPQEVAGKVLRALAGHLEAVTGGVYIAEADAPMLRPVATFAPDRDAVPIVLGEGIPGQAAVEGMTKVVYDLPADSPFRIGGGNDSAAARSVVASPMKLGDRVLGVIVLGWLEDMPSDAPRFVESIAGQLGITLDNALAHVRIETLAAEVQEKNEVLQSQNEELQVQGEELQAQSEELQAQNEELATQAEELHAQSEELRMQQDALAQTNDALVAAGAQKNRFLAVLGHELRNPLAAISAAVDILRDGADADEVPQLTDVLQRQTAHLGRLLDDLLDIGRITTGKVVLTCKPVDLAATVRRCAGTIRSASSLPSARRVRVDADEQVWVYADETRIEQIVTNLLTNAVKYTPADGDITVKVGRNQSGAFVQVTDTGIGIGPELLPRVFDFFVQGDPRGDGPKRGLGVGLTLVKNLIELHGGTVAAASDGPGKGTTMTVCLPLLEGPSPDAQPAAAYAPVACGRSIVLIEDNEDVRRMMQLLFTRAGHSVAEAFDGPSGVDTVTSVKPDIALVDLDLPGFDGFEVARRLRRDPGLASVRLIAVSGYGRPEDREQAIAAGFDDHLVKPLDFDRLTRTVLTGRVDA